MDAHYDLIAALLGHDDRLHRHAPGGQLIDHGDVEVGKGGHRKRARDGSRRHDELVRKQAAFFALLLQPQPLLHAEAVLLVDDDEGKLREINALLKRAHVCRDDEAHVALRDGQASALRRSSAGCEPDTSATGIDSG